MKCQTLPSGLTPLWADPYLGWLPSLQADPEGSARGPGGGGVLHNDNDNDDTDMIPLGRPDFIALGLKKTKKRNTKVGTYPRMENTPHSSAILMISGMMFSSFSIDNPQAELPMCPWKYHHLNHSDCTFWNFRQKKIALQCSNGKRKHWPQSTAPFST